MTDSTWLRYRGLVYFGDKVAHTRSTAVVVFGGPDGQGISTGFSTGRYSLGGEYPEGVYVVRILVNFGGFEGNLLKVQVSGGGD